MSARRGTTKGVSEAWLFAKHFAALRFSVSKGCVAGIRKALIVALLSAHVGMCQRMSFGTYAPAKILLRPQPRGETKMPPLPKGGGWSPSFKAA
jgi:hypothetical protein